MKSFYENFHRKITKKNEIPKNIMIKLFLPLQPK